MTMIRAVTFPDANTYLHNSHVNGSPPPSVSKGFISYWVKYTGSLPNFDILSAAVSTSGYNAGLTLSPFALVISAQDTTTRYEWQANFASPPANDGHWHHVLWVFDTQQDTTNPTTGHVYIDNVPYTVNITGNGIPFNLILYNLDMTIGAVAGLSLAELFVYVGPASNIDDPAVRAQFIDPTTHAPQYLGCNGMVPFGVKPTLYMWGDADLFPWNFSQYAKLPLILEVDLSNPSPASYQVIGTLQTATNDPFGGQAGV